jgi:pimeloyl-ACP methyl ester carboxylesterase
MRRRLGSDFPSWQCLHDKPGLTRAEEHEFCLLQWRPDYAPGPAAADTLAAALPDVQRVVIDGAGHLPWAEQPAAVAAAVCDFIVKRDPGQAAN